MPIPNITTRKILDGDGHEHHLRRGDVIRLNDGVCYKVSFTSDCAAATTSVLAIEKYDGGCPCCKLTKWHRCDEAGPDITTYSDLCPYQTSSYAINRLEDGYCYKFDSVVPEDEWTGDEVEFTPDGIYKDEDDDPCIKCVGPRYLLTPCDACADCGSGDDPPEPILANNRELQAFIGKFVKIGGVCYLVAEDESTDETRAIVFDGPYQTCEGCAAASSCVEVLKDVECIDGELVKTYVKLKGIFLECGTRRDPPEA